MTDIIEIVRSLPAGSRVVIIEATLPDGTTFAGVVPPPSDPAGAEPPPEPGAQTPKPDSADGDQRVGDRLTMSLRPTPLETARRIAAEDETRSLKPREWAEVLGMSAREISRAVEAGAVGHLRKKEGRDHGARVVSAAAMVQLLATIDAVERLQLEPPAWWDDVRGRRAARVVSPRARATA